MSDKIIILRNIGELVTPRGTTPARGKKMSELTVIKNAEVVIKNGIIDYVGEARDVCKSVCGTAGKNSEAAVVTCAEMAEAEVIDCGGKAVLPGFVDSHTHLVFGGYRADEFLWRQSGVSYMEIMNRGGGIACSVAATREETEDVLLNSAKQRLRELACFGVTTAEIKSGYGLDLDTEIKQLRVINRLKKEEKQDIVATFMGAHSVPKEYKGRNLDYINYIIESVLPAVKAENLAEFVDIFCEKGVFSTEESELLLSAARQMGFETKIHADEIVSTGGAELASKIGCTSADHLLHASPEGIKALAGSDTVATLLPLTAFCLREPYADARAMIDGGCAVSLATDFNPGSCFSCSVPLMIALAVIYMKMSIEEVVTALTLNAACALKRGETHGSIEVGKRADLVILQYPSIAFLAYHTGVNCVEKVIKSGEIIVG